MPRLRYSRLRRVLCLSEFVEPRTFIGSHVGLTSRAGQFLQNRPHLGPRNTGLRALWLLPVPVRSTASLLRVSVTRSGNIFSCFVTTLARALRVKLTGPTRLLELSLKPTCLFPTFLRHIGRL